MTQSRYGATPPSAGRRSSLSVNPKLDQALDNADRLANAVVQRNRGHSSAPTEIMETGLPETDPRRRAAPSADTSQLTEAVRLAIYVARSNTEWQKHAGRMILISTILSGIGAGVAIITFLAFAISR